MSTEYTTQYKNREVLIGKRRAGPKGVLFAFAPVIPYEAPYKELNGKEAFHYWDKHLKTSHVIHVDSSAPTTWGELTMQLEQNPETLSEEFIGAVLKS